MFTYVEDKKDKAKKQKQKQKQKPVYFPTHKDLTKDTTPLTPEPRNIFCRQNSNNSHKIQSVLYIPRYCLLILITTLPLHLQEMNRALL